MITGEYLEMLLEEMQTIEMQIDLTEKEIDLHTQELAILSRQKASFERVLNMYTKATYPKEGEQ